MKDERRAAGYLDVTGRCPACGAESLHLSMASRMIVCLAPQCPDKGAAQRPLLLPKVGEEPVPSYGGMIHGTGMHQHKREIGWLDHSHLGGNEPHEHDENGAQVKTGEVKAADELVALTEDLGLYDAPVLRRVTFDSESGEAALEPDIDDWHGRLIRLRPQELADYEQAVGQSQMWQRRLWGSAGEYKAWLDERTVEEECSTDDDKD